MDLKDKDFPDIKVPPTYLHRLIALPNDRIFIIGGANDIQCSSTRKDTVELVKDDAGKYVRTARTQMW